MRIVGLSIISAALAAAAPVLGQGTLTGTWKADPQSAQLPAKPMVRLLKAGIYSCTSGCTLAGSVAADGKPHRVVSPTADERTVTVIDANTVRMVARFHGKPMSENTYSVSPDGNTLTVAYKDLSGETGAPVTGQSIQTRVGPKPAGAHAISGSWRETAFTSTDNGLVVNIKDDGRTLGYSDPTGYNYTAVYGGPAVRVKGDVTGGMARVARVNASTVTITGTRGGKITFINTIVLDPDGRTLTMTLDDKVQGAVTKMRATKQ